MYTPRNPPMQWDPQWAAQEFQNIRASMQEAVDGVIYKTLYAEPSRIYDGLTVKADGTTWDPGSGAGCYQYRGGAWRFLG